MTTSFWTEELPKLALERLAAMGEDGNHRHDLVVLDEAQDVLWNDAYLEFLDCCLVGGIERGQWLMCGDFASQSVHEFSPEQATRFMARTHGLRIELDSNCRNNRRVGQFATRVMNRTRLYHRYRRSDDAPDDSVQLLAYANHDEQARLLRDLLNRIAPNGPRGNEKIAILSGCKTDSGIAAALMSDPTWGKYLRRLKLAEPFTSEEQETLRALLTGRWDSITYCSAFTFKGLEAHTVILTDVEPDALDPDIEVLRTLPDPLAAALRSRHPQP